LKRLRTKEKNLSDYAVLLLTVVEVDKNDRVKCQAIGCGRPVHKRIHVAMIGKDFKVLGSDCYQKLYGDIGSKLVPKYGTTNGRRLSAQERLLLIENTEKFIEYLESERAEIERIAALKSKREMEEKNDARRMYQHRFSPQRPQYIADDNFLTSPYEGANMIRWKWKEDKTIIANILAAYKTNSSRNRNVDIVVKCFEKHSCATPYMFALGVEMKFFLPKPNALRALDELGLIEQI
jgi:hypothetical protein